VAIDFLLPSSARQVTVEILDARGELVRRYASDDVAPPPLADRNIPDYWIRPPVRVGTTAGSHRIYWDLRYMEPVLLDRSYPISASLGNTPAEPRGPIAPPAVYKVRLTVDGTSIERSLQLRIDPTLRIPAVALQTQHVLAESAYNGALRASVLSASFTAWRTAIAERRTKPGSALAALIRLDSLVNRLERGDANGPAPSRLMSELQQLYEQVDGVDAVAPPAVASAIKARLSVVGRLESGVAELQKVINREFNPVLREAGVPEIVLPAR
jgi:hypothetical protein